MNAPEAKWAELGLRVPRPRITERRSRAAAAAQITGSRCNATAGLELEPIGAMRYLLGIRSWY